MSALISKAKGLAPIIGVLGHRQVGKTTLLESLTNNYITLDDSLELEQANNTPKEFLKKNAYKFCGIDECQLSPALFPALKEHVRKNKSPGQFLLSGSVRFTSRKAIQESLTGRIINFELLPLSISEIAHLDLPDSIDKLTKSTSLDRALQSIGTPLLSIKSKEYNYYLKNGGLPGVCFVKNDRMRELKINDQLMTMIDRDLRLIIPTTISYSQLYETVRFIALHQGENFNLTTASKFSKISTISLKKILYALEGIFLIRKIPIEGDINNFTYYLEDHAESLYLQGGQISQEVAFEQLIYRNVRNQLYYSIGANFREFSYGSKNGVRIPYCIYINNRTLGILPIQNSQPSQKEKAAGASFLKRYENGRMVYVHEQKEASIIDNRSVSLPVFSLV